MRLGRVTAGLVIALSALAQDGTEAAAVEQARLVLGRFPAAPEGSRVYELSVAPCASGQCPIEVCLLDGDRLIARAPLDWVAPEQMAMRALADDNSRIGDPLQIAVRPEVWSWGTGDAALAAAARKVVLSRNRRGLLIDLIAGSGQRRQRHYLYVANGDQLLRAWAAADQEGPHWTSVELTSSAGSSAQSILLFEAFQPGGDQPDQVEVKRFVWDDGSRKVEQKESVPDVYTITIGVWATVAEARRVRAQAGACLDPFWVAPLESAEGPFGLRAVTANKDLASEALSQAENCMPNRKGRLSKYRP